MDPFVSSPGQAAVSQSLSVQAQGSTDADSGIGRAIVERLALAGARVIAVDVVFVELSGVAEGDFLLCDQGSEESVSKFGSELRLRCVMINVASRSIIAEFLLIHAGPNV
jgi:NAD(P)-dependent dehydrogenase (short-subunit alcohol dehydrogenase family)